MSFLEVPLYCAAAVQAVFLIATLANYVRTRARPYIFFALSFLCAIGTILMVLLLVLNFESTMSKLGGITSSNTSGNGFDSFQQQSKAFTDATLALVPFEIGAFIFTSLGELAADLGILSLLGSWFLSMQTVLSAKAASGLRVVKFLRILFILWASLAVLFLVLGWLVDLTMLLWVFIASIALTLTEVFLFAYVIWILVDSNLSIESLRTKKNQLWLIFALVLLTPVLALVIRYLGLIFWLIRCIIIVWPKALSGFEQPPVNFEYQPQAGYQRELGYQQEIGAAKV